MTRPSELNDKQFAFVQNYATHGNAARAAREAGYAASVANKTGYKLLAMPKVTEAIRKASLSFMEAHLPSVVQVLAQIVGDPSVEARDRVKAGELFLKYTKPANVQGPAVAVQINMGKDDMARQVQDLIREVHAGRSSRALESGHDRLQIIDG